MRTHNARIKNPMASKLVAITRVVLLIIAIWQVVGMLPALTWLGKLDQVTTHAWFLMLVKTVVLFISGGIAIFLGRFQEKGAAKRSEKTAVKFVFWTFILGVVTTLVLVYFYSSNDTSQGGNEAVIEQDQDLLFEFAQEIPESHKVGVTVFGITNDGDLAYQVSNKSTDWLVTRIKIRIINSQQQLDFLNGYRSEPGYSQLYDLSINVPAGAVESFNVQTNWLNGIEYLVDTQVLGIR